MKILLINTYDLRGGAARATWRLFEGIKSTGHEVTLLVQEKKSDDPSVVVSASPGSGFFNPFRPYVDFAVPLIFTRKRVLFSTSMIPDNLLKEIDRLNPDVVHLNWIAGGFIRIETIAKINKPLVWTFQDMWAFTGGCHYSGDCRRYLEECGKCPVLNSTAENDLSYKVFQRKLKSYSAVKNLTITTPSTWLATIVRESKLMQGRNVRVVPNSLNTSVFQSSGREAARERLALSPGKKIILFGAIRATETPLKGFGLLVEALKILSRSDLQLVVFGSANSANIDIAGLDVRFLGAVNSQQMLIDLYSAADVMAVPSLQEVFGQVATEAMACCTPVVAFNSTGLQDIIVHKETGYLATPFLPGDLAAGIGWMLADEGRRLKLGEASRARTISSFDTAVAAQKMINIYQEAIDAGKV